MLNDEPRKYGAGRSLSALKADMPDFILLMHNRPDLHLVLDTAAVVDTAIRWNI